MINRNALRAVFEGALRLSPEESLLVVTDHAKEEIGRAFYDLGAGITSRADILVMDEAEEHAAEPPEHIARAMLEHDVQILVTAKSLTHTAARRKATEKGARIATMPGITEEIANRCLDVDYEELRQSSRQVHGILRKAGAIRVTTALGTYITFRVGKSLFFGQDGGVLDKPGAFGNLPEGEVSFAPEEAEGTFVVDASFPDLGVLKSPLFFKVKDCRAVEIKGQQADIVKKRLDRAGEKAYHIAELGIGLNPKAVVNGNILEDEKVIGTVHIALGNNLSYGGTNDVPLHLDGVITTPDIIVDGEKLMERGRFCGTYLPRI